MDRFRLPDPLSFEGNVSENWKRWIQKFNLYLIASGSDKKDDPTRVAILLHCGGDEVVDVYNTFTFDTEGDDTKLEVVIKKFEEYCNPRKNTVIERYLFWEQKQKPGESIDHYITELKNRAKSCEFGAQANFMIRDRIVFGVTDERLKERLLRDSADPPLERVVEMCRASEASTAQISLTQQHDKSLHVLKKSHFSKKTHEKKEPDKKTFNCKRCGTRHGYKECPAYGKTCGKCRLRGHLTSQCFTKQSQKDTQKNTKGNHKKDHKVHTVDEIDFISDRVEDELFIGSVNVDSINTVTSWYESVRVLDKNIKFKLDTGAEANVIPAQIFAELECQKPLSKPRTVLSGYGNNKLKVIGEITLPCLIGTSKRCDLDFIIAEVNSPPVLSLETCSNLGLVTRNVAIHEVTQDNLMKDYGENFTGLGHFKGKYHIELDVSVKPVIHPPRKVPYSMHVKLKETLDRLEEAKVIAKVEQATDWVNSLVIVEKSDSSLRLCLDPKDLNRAIKREHFKIPTPEDISAQLSGKKVFSILDEKDSYWQVELDEESSYLCTFNTPFGRYRFKRMPFGISSASEVFQRKNQETFGDIKGVQMVSDDMIIAGSDEEDHDRILLKVMERAKVSGVKFNKKKVQLRVKQVKYLGNIITEDGMKPDDEKIKAIVNMPFPECRQDVQRFLGTVNFLSQYIPNMSEITAPLRELLKKDCPWIWEHEHNDALNKLKKILTSKPVLKFFDVTKPVTIQADASQHGLGACLFQEGHPIVYSSRALTQAESNYAQIEKELLAIVFACEKFNQYIYGKVVKVESDHKPLETILRKPLHKASPRLQRMMMRLQKYQLDVSYVPGKHMYIADTLSRAFLSEYPDNETIEEEAEIMIHTVKTNLPMTAEKLAEFETASKEDPAQQQLRNLIKSGWPTHKWQSHSEARPYWTMRDEIHEIEGLVFVGEKLIVPQSLREQMLITIHEGHLSMEKCKSRARQIIYWPGMSKDIEEIVSRCATCVKYQRSNVKEPMIPHDIPHRPWEKVGIDLFEFDCKDYVLIVDYFSKFIEISLLKDKTADTVITSIKSIFARHGIPDTVISDNMPFASTKFQNFAQIWGFQHITSSPTYAQSNGMAERSIQTIKQLLRKSKEEGKDCYLALMHLRNSPISGMNVSPAQLLMSRSLKTKLPTTQALLQPKIITSAITQLQCKQSTQMNYYNRNTRELPPLNQNDKVRVQRNNTWEPATVVNSHNTPRSFIVATESGKTLRRNRRDLHKMPSNPQDENPSSSHGYNPDTPVEENTPSTTPATSPSTPISTRAGRIVRRPDRFSDFDCG